MRRTVCLLILILVFAPISSVSGTQNDSDETTYEPIFGGASIAANTSGAVEIPFSNLPALAEDFTATWCDNCVYVEKALHEVANETGAEVLHFHRNNDYEDPFGSDSGSSWWQKRYDTGIPPTVVFNGEELEAGSVPEGDSLKEDYSALIARNIDIGDGDSQFTWVLAADNTTGVFSWSLQYNSSNPTFAERQGVNSWLFIIEDSANFPEGSNGVEDYTHIVHEVIDLGLESEGMTTVTLPDAYDGNDLTIMLIHEFLPKVEPDCCTDEGDSDDSGFLPSISLFSTISVLAIAAIIGRK